MTRFETRLLLAAMVAWLLAGIVAILVGPPLGYDEAAFASLARGADTPNWRYRSHAVILLAKIGVALGGSELALRVPFLLVGLGLPLAAFALGRAAFDARTGAWAAAVLATSHQLLYRASQVLGDVPSTAALLGALAIVIGEFTRGPTRRLLWAAPCFAAAFYFRYGNAPVVAVAMVAAPFVWWRVARANAGLVLATGGLFAVLLVPHVVQSLHETGSPLGLLTFSAGVPRRAFVGEGLVTYVTANPLLYYGALVAPCMLAGLATLASRRRAPTFLAGVGLAQIASVGLSSHAQPRYVFAGVCILAILGVAVWRGRGSRSSCSRSRMHGRCAGRSAPTRCRSCRARRT